jgi:hypothetical protein
MRRAVSVPGNFRKGSLKMTGIDAETAQIQQEIN